MLEHPRTALRIAIALAASAAVTLGAQAPAAATPPAAHATAPGYVFRFTNSLEHVAAPGADDTPPPDDPNANNNNNGDPGGNGRGGRGGRGGGAPGGGRGAGVVANGPTSRLVASVQAANGEARFDVSGLMGAADLNVNQYLLTTDSSRSQTLIDMSAHTYQKRVPTTGTLVEMVAALDAHSVVWMVHVAFDTLPAGPGDTVEGRPTKHYRIEAQYTTEMKDSLGQLAPHTAKYATDYWVADLPIHVFNPFLSFAWPKPGYSPGLKVWIDKLVAAEDFLSNNGLIVKVHSEAILGTENPKSGTYVRELEVTGITPKDIDLSELDVPDGYKPGGGRRGGGGTR